ncbi:MAG: imidazole glycerol phosphate synthase subunit HisH [Leptospiraceae bacterium]|nr:imidazole glycerol phosphate synthase subunit HisH [Leptospiraceae bacterium]
MANSARILELDFGMGNIRSLEKALQHLGANVEVSSDPHKISSADAIVLPGDGAFGAAMQQIKQRGMLEPLQKFHRLGKPILGICIGFQILFEESTEYGTHNGLNWLPGSIEKFSDEWKSERVTVPHMGWETVEPVTGSKLFAGLPQNPWFYFVHSYRRAYTDDCEDFAAAICDYAGDFVAAIEHDNLWGVQFHPEKSHATGLKLLQNFIDFIQK